MAVSPFSELGEHTCERPFFHTISDLFQDTYISLNLSRALKLHVVYVRRHGIVVSLKCMHSASLKSGTNGGTYNHLILTKTLSHNSFHLNQSWKLI